MDFYKSMTSLNDAQRVTFLQLDADCKAYHADLEALLRELRNTTREAGGGALEAEKMSTFASKTRESVDEIETDVGAARKKFQALVKYLGESTETTTEALFRNLSVFLNVFRKNREQMDAQRLRAEKERVARAQKEARLSRKKEGKSIKGRSENDDIKQGSTEASSLGVEDGGIEIKAKAKKWQPPKKTAPAAKGNVVTLSDKERAAKAIEEAIDGAFAFDEDQDEAVAHNDSRSLMLAAIQARRNEENGDEGASKVDIPAHNDPRAAMLAAIAARRKS